MGRGHAGRQGRREDGLRPGLPRLRCGRGPDAGRAHLAIDVRPQLLPRGAGDGFSDIGHRPSSVGLRGKALGVPVYRLLGGPLDPRGVRGYYHADGVRTPDALAKLRETAIQQGVSCFKTGLPAYYEWIETRKKISTAVKSMQMLRESLGPDIDIAVDFHAKTSPSVASILVKEVEPLNLLFIEEPCPPENVQAMAKIARRSTTPIATGERLVGIFGVREICEMGVVDILQTDINHVGGITGLWKVSQMADMIDIGLEDIH